MGNFRVGQKVVCIKHDPICVHDGKSYPAPKKDEIVTISKIDRRGWLLFQEYSELFPHPDGGLTLIVHEPCCFRPLELDYDFVGEVLKKVTPKEEVWKELV